MSRVPTDNSWKRCYAYAIKKGFSREDAEDFAQEATIEFWQGRRTGIRNLWVDFIRNKIGRNKQMSETDHWLRKNLENAPHIETILGNNNSRQRSYSGSNSTSESGNGIGSNIKNELYEALNSHVLNQKKERSICAHNLENYSMNTPGPNNLSKDSRNNLLKDSGQKSKIPQTKFNKSAYVSKDMRDSKKLNAHMLPRDEFSVHLNGTLNQIGVLNPLERTMCVLMIEWGFTLAELSQVFGVTDSRMTQIHKELISKIINKV